MKKDTIAIISGGFDPVHIGHLDMMQDALRFGHRLIVILNNDYWLMKKKGFIFMKEYDRKYILSNFRQIDKVLVSRHKYNPEDMSVCAELRHIFKHFGQRNKIIFCNGGDRTKHNTPEMDVCKELGIEMRFNVGGKKVESSSELVLNAMRAIKHGIHK